MSLALITSSVDQVGLSKYLSEIKKIPYLEQEEEYDLAKRMIEHKDIKAAHKLIISHLRLVVKVAFDYKGYGLPIVDMIAEGNLGLMQAVKKFNPELGYRLSTYAMWWIKAAIQEYILKSFSLVKMGTTVAQKRLFFSLRKVKAKISKLENNHLSLKEAKEIAKLLKVEENEVFEMDTRIRGGDVSLNRIVGEDNSAEAIDFIADNKASQEEILSSKQEKSYRQKKFSEALTTLDDREKLIISKRYLTETPVTLENLSKDLSVSTERVRQIEAKAIKKLKLEVQKSDKN